MGRNDRFTLEDVGAVPIYARHRRSELYTALGHPLREIETLSQSYAAKITEKDRQEERLRISFVGGFFEYAFSAALTSAISYFRYFEICHSKVHQQDCEQVCKASLDLAHHFADAVSIDLYNAAKILDAPEMKVVLQKRSTDIAEVLNGIFPYLTAARDAVCHYHDRDMGRNKDKQVSDSIGGRPITPSGKKYISRQGEEFEFCFEIKQFRKFLTDVNQIMS